MSLLPRAVPLGLKKSHHYDSHCRREWGRSRCRRLAESLARPGGNVTGLSILGPELITKRLEILKETVPKLARVGVLMRAGVGAGTGQQQQMEEISAAATALKLGLQELPTELDADALDRTFKAAGQQHQRDYSDCRSANVRRKKIDRAACHQISVAGDLSGARVC